MKVPTLYSPWKRPEKHMEIPGTETMVETAGYRTPKQQIEEYMDAGRRLQAGRELKYDFAPGEPIDENFEDRTRRPGYDPADATQDLRQAEASLRESAREKKEAKQKALEEASIKEEEELRKKAEGEI